MKKLLLPLLAILFLISCEKESTTDLQPDQEYDENGTATLRGPAPKIDVCHYDAENNTWHVINISENAWPAHAGHGDVRLDDQDDDSYVPDNACDYGQQGDCDDLNAAVNPGATEDCEDGIDNDCDGDTDEDDNDCSTSCVEGELPVVVDPNGISGDEDDYTIYVYPMDNSTGIPWSNSFTNTGATNNWDGVANTDAIVADQGAGTNYAAGLCASLEGCDWYLPAKNELDAMYEQLGPNGTGSNEMPNGIYWSSTEDGTNDAWFQFFNFGDQTNDLKGDGLRCRCVRR